MYKATSRTRRTLPPLALAAGLVAVSVLASGCSLFGSTTTPTTSKTTTATVTQGNLQVGLVSDGRVVLSTTSLNFTVSATVKAIHVAVGDKVQTGDILAELDDASLQRALLTATNGLKRATATYNDAVVQRKINLLTQKIKLADAKAKYELDKTNELAGLNYELEKERYSNLLNYDVSVITAELAKEDAQTALESAQANLEKTVLLATMDGTVSAVNYKVGETVTVNANNPFSTSTAFITLIDPTVVYVTSSVTEGDIAGVKIGQTMKITIDAATLTDIAGKVTDVTSSPNIATTGIVTYTVTGTLDDPNVEILAGMSAVITFIKSEKDGVLLVPVKAVSLSTDGIQSVNVKKADGTIEKRTVETGLSNGVQTEVISGLTEGETVVIGSVSK